MDRPALSSRLDGFGTTIFAEMSALAARTGAINLGQGFPDTDGPPEVLEAAVQAMRAGRTAEGEESAFLGHDVLRLRDGRIAEYWVVSWTGPR